MDEIRVKRIMKGLKIKKCEGVDRIPLRVLNDGAEILYKPVTALMTLTYSSKKIPDQWRMAKVIPTHKNGTRAMVLKSGIHQACH